MSDTSDDKIKEAVREHYGDIARQHGATSGTNSCCGPRQESSCCRPAQTSSCCGPADLKASSSAYLYPAAEVAGLPDSVTDMSLGCGNPLAIADLKPGEVVLDLGSGGGIDCFLAARRVGPQGRVIGLDMTPDMIRLAQRNAKKVGAWNVEFRLGEIEDMPLPDQSVDAIISNCVINLSPEKGQVFREAFRVLKPGGRLAVSDVVRTGALPPALAGDGAAYCGCVSGAVTVQELEALLRDAGFSTVTVGIKSDSAAIVGQWLPGSGVEHFVASASITATKE